MLYNKIDIKPTLHSHTHCQVAPADPQAKTWQRVCLSQRTTDRQSERKKNTERTTACIKNSGFSAKSKVRAFNKSMYLTESAVRLNPLLFIHAKRYKQLIEGQELKR